MLFRFAVSTAYVVLPRPAKCDVLPEIQLQQRHHPLSVVLTREQVLQFITQDYIIGYLHLIIEHRHACSHHFAFAFNHALVVCLVHQQGVQAPLLGYFLVKFQMDIGVVRSLPAHVNRP